MRHQVEAEGVQAKVSHQGVCQAGNEHKDAHTSHRILYETKPSVGAHTSASKICTTGGLARRSDCFMARFSPHSLKAALNQGFRVVNVEVLQKCS